MGGARDCDDGEAGRSRATRGAPTVSGPLCAWSAIPRRELRWVLAAFALAVAFRAALVLYFSGRSPTIEDVGGDSGWYLRLAATILESGFEAARSEPDRFFVRPPGQSLWLACLLAVTGGNLLAVKLVNVLVSATGVFWLAEIAARLAKERPGLCVLAAFVYALNIAQAWLCLGYLTEIVVVPGFLLFACLVAIVAPISSH
jgi:hypothetical protein